MKKEKNTVWRGLVQVLKLPEDAFISQSCIEVRGQQEIVLEGAKNILEYNNERLRIQTIDHNITVEGKSLRIDIFVKKVMVIRGEIRAVVFG